MIKHANLYDAVRGVLPPEQIDHHYSDLYFKCTRKTVDIVKSYEYRHQVTTFRDQTTGEIWFEAPFAYPGEWTK